MKVSELKVGMLLEPIPGYIFLKMPKNFHLEFNWVAVRSEDYVPWNHFSAMTTGAAPEALNCHALYIGNRKQAGVQPSQFDWSDRYVMIDGDLAAVEPSSWRHITLTEKRESRRLS